MKAVMLDVPAELLEHRRAAGRDKADEMWEGVLHMVPPPTGQHQRLGTRLLFALGPLARQHGLEPLQDGTGLYSSDNDWRVPDQQYVRPDQMSDRGTEGAELVVEILSPGDESRAKLGWYGEVGVTEVVVIDPVTYAVEIHRLVAGSQIRVAPEPAGLVTSTVLGCTFEATTGGLRVAWDEGSTTVSGATST